MATHAELPDEDSDTEPAVATPLPEILYARWDKDPDPDGEECEYLVTSQQPHSHCSHNGEITVGEYKLVRMVTVRSVVTVRPADETPLTEPAAE